MLAPASEKLLTRFLYSLAVFASDLAMENLGISPDIWNTIMLLVVFVIARTLLTHCFDAWNPITREVHLLKDIVQTFVDANWTTILFIIVQWVVDLFKGFWRLSASPIIGVISMEIPLLILTALIYSSYDSPFELTSANKVADNMLASINFAIAFFVADMLVVTMRVTPAPWDFMWVLVSFVALRALINTAFDAWKTDHIHKGTGALKLILVENVNTLMSIGIFILTKLFVGIFGAWWVEGEHWIVAAVIFQTFLLMILALMHYLRELASNKDNVPDAMVNRSLFAMAMFIAEKARSMNTATFTEFELLILAVSFIALHAITTLGLKKWKIGKTTEELGERVLKATIQKNAFTWITITVVFLVRLLVDIYKRWWRDEPTAIIGAVLIESTVLLLVACVKVLMFFEAEGFIGKRAY
jgi:hypothetical protein